MIILKSKIRFWTFFILLTINNLRSNQIQSKSFKNLIANHLRTYLCCGNQNIHSNDKKILFNYISLNYIFL